ncbi:MAG: phosphomethylpyrimidine synthase ThiC [Candidatus Omnitrophota bacterium]|nr:phosphomethylpyrimidine synthase ThiC [Candidatus Omnitrophota bacterium]
MTQFESAKKGIITEKMRLAAKSETSTAEYIRKGIANGSIVLPSNISRKITRCCAVGKGLRTKVNANIGSSAGCENIETELKKLRAAVEAGADTVMDLSTGDGLIKIRSSILKKSDIPVGTVPIYEMAVKKLAAGKNIADISKDDMLECLESQAIAGVDFFTVHCGVTKKALSKLRDEGRILDVVSRGGALIAQWIAKTGKENPFYVYYDEILDIAHKYDVTLSLGDGMRPGCIKDATDKAQITELKTLGALATRARKAGVQVMIEGPGHVPINQIKRNIEMEKSICDNAPFYVLGPIVTDIAPGYDHITSAIGGALAAYFGADFLCYVTPAEHLRLPTVEDVKEGVIASRIAAHAADVAKGIKGAIDLDNTISLARKRRDWKKQIDCSIDPKKAREYRATSVPITSDVCTMCNKYCSIKLFEEAAASGKKS